MKHEEWDARISQYLDGELTADAGAQVRAHLEACPVCAETARRWSELRNRIRDAAIADLPAAFADEIREVVLTQDDFAGAWETIEPSARRTVLALAVIALVLLFLTVPLSSEDPVQVNHVIMTPTRDTIAAQVLLNTGELTKNDVLTAALFE